MDAHNKHHLNFKQNTKEILLHSYFKELVTIDIHSFHKEMWSTKTKKLMRQKE